MFICGHHTHGILILHFTYGRRYVALRNVVFLGWDILIIRRNGIHVKYLKSNTYGSVALSLPSLEAVIHLKEHFRNVDFSSSFKQHVTVTKKYINLVISSSLWAVLCAVAKGEDQCIAQISKCDSYFSVDKGVTFLTEISMAVNKPRIFNRRFSKISPVARATSTPVSEVLCRTEFS